MDIITFLSIFISMCIGFMYLVQGLEAQDKLWEAIETFDELRKLDEEPTVFDKDGYYDPVNFIDSAMFLSMNNE